MTANPTQGPAGSEIKDFVEIAAELRRLAGSKPGVAQAGYVTVSASELEYLAGQIAARRDALARKLEEAKEALETFAIMVNEDTDYLPDEHVITLSYDDTALDEELGGPNTLLGERFMRAFRRAAQAHATIAGGQGE